MLLAVAILFSAIVAFAADIHPVKGVSDTTKKAKTAKVVYTCPMHTDVVSYKPGKCPKPNCGMTLVKKSDLKKKPTTMKM
ncbi:MAG: actP [Mucilaginibacter sp.]|nr:actP [Mucilaginibacter sp.]MDB5016349.1 actP [Mucilaginibacter sp.]